MRSSMTCKAGLASSFFIDETCWISAFIALMSFSENDIIGVRSLAKLCTTQRNPARESLGGILHAASTPKTGAWGSGEGTRVGRKGAEALRHGIGFSAGPKRRHLSQQEVTCFVQVPGKLSSPLAS